MSTDANPTPGGGLKSTLKIAVPVVAFVAVIFGVTLLSQYTPKSVDDEKKEGDQTKQHAGQPPLVFFSSERMWDPPSLDPEWQHLPLLAPSRDPSKAENPFAFSLQDRIFPGFYEPGGDQVRRAQFWFENRNPNRVTLQLKGVNCGSCSGGRLAAIPPAITRDYLHRVALAALPIGAFNPFGVGLGAPAGDLTKLDWTTHKFSESPNATYQVPAAPQPADKWAPQWGILELTFTVGENPKVPLRSEFATKVDGTEQVGAHEFKIYFAPSKACDVFPPSIPLPPLDRLSGDREESFLVYSATRGPGSEFGDLDRPAYVVQAPGGGDPGKFVEVTKVERVPDAKLFEVVREVNPPGKFTKVQAAYRVTVAVRPKVGETRLDIGKMDRTIFLTVGKDTHSVSVSAMVRGAVGLADGKTDIELPTFKGRLGLVASPVSLVTEATGMELAVVEAECKPRGFKYELVKKEDRGGQGYYDLLVTIPPKQQFGAIPPDAIVVIEVKGPNPQRIRIPLRGKGEQG